MAPKVEGVKNSRIKTTTRYKKLVPKHQKNSLYVILLLSEIPR
jgi:hypothetical protein